MTYDKFVFWTVIAVLYLIAGALTVAKCNREWPYHKDNWSSWAITSIVIVAVWPLALLNIWWHHKFHDDLDE